MIAAGVDVGNATTEVVLVRHDDDGPTVLAADRVPTRGAKGSPASLEAAASVVQRLERRAGAAAELAAVAPLRAVDTATVAVPAPPPDTGRLTLISTGAGTPGSAGQGVGRPHRLGAGEPPGGPVVVLVPVATGYRQAVEEVGRLLAAGVAVAAVAVGGDEGVLVANRLARSLPVVDQVDVDAMAGAHLVAVEVRPPGEPLRLLGDPVALGAAFGLAPGEATDAAALTRQLVDRSNAVVALGERPTAQPAEPSSWVALAGGPVEFHLAVPRLADLPVGAAGAYRLAGGEAVAVDDLWAVDVGQVADRAGAHRGSQEVRPYLLAALRRAGRVEHAALLADQLGIEVRTSPSEAAAARRGALTTPGADPGGLVVDLGAGTVDAIGSEGEVVAAGAGELLTQAVAAALGITRSAADWVKRGPAIRVEGGGRFEAEDASRGFLERPAPPAAAGMLAVPGPAGLLPFDRTHAPAEWRSLRLALKEAVLGANLARVLADREQRPGRQVLVVGGPAGDDELVGVLSRALGDPVVVGRAAVGATLGRAPGVAPLGHRYAAALGLALSVADPGSA